MLSSTLHGCFQTRIQQVTSRKLLVHSDVLLFNQQHSAAGASTPAAAPLAASSTIEFSSLYADVIMILAALLCALVCVLIVNAVVRCVCVVAGGGRAWLELAADGSRDHPCASECHASARVGRKRAVRSLPCFAYSPGAQGVFLRSGTECVICLSEFAPGQRVRVLPKCGHGFHVRCIDRWLASQSSCPTCRQCLFGNEEEETGRPAEPGDVSVRVMDEFREEYQ